MFGHHAERVRKGFADQFDEENGRIVYRQSLRGAPIPVSAAERDAAIARFVQDWQRLTWGLLGVILLVVVLTIAVSIHEGWEPSPVVIGAPVVIVVIGFYMMTRRVWAAPARLFERRPALGVARSRREARRAALAKTSWRQLGGSALAFVAVGASHAMHRDGLQGWNRLWLAVCAAGLALAGWRAIQKWRLERGPNPSSSAGT